MISQTPPPQPPENTLQLVIRTRQDMLYQGRVKAVSSVNDTGPFDVLAHHAYFISVIQKQITIHEIDGLEVEFFSFHFPIRSTCHDFF
jgi:F0F1-type ATP synthase epsilon subunit